MEKLLVFCAVLLQFRGHFAQLLPKVPKTDLNVEIQPIFAAVGDTAVIECNYTLRGPPQPVIFRWYARPEGARERQLLFYYDVSSRQHGKVEGFAREIHSGADGQLVVPDVTFDDEKLLKSVVCLVEAGALTRQAGASFHAVALARNPAALFARPIFILAAPPAPQVVGTCIASGLPRPKVWFHRGASSVPLPSAPEGSEVPVVETRTGRLIQVVHTLVMNLTWADNLTPIFCSVESGTRHVTSLVTVAMQPELRIRHDVTTVTIRAHPPPPHVLGDNVTLTCAHDGFPDVDVDFNGKPDLSQWVVLEQPRDIEASCTVGLPLSTTVTSDIIIVVNFMSDVNIVAVPGLEVEVGESVHLNCSVESKPEPQITWFKDDVRLADSSAVYVAEVTSEDEGKYQCIADNGVETMKKSAQVSLVVKDGWEKMWRMMKLAGAGVGGALLLLLISVCCYRRSLPTDAEIAFKADLVSDRYRRRVRNRV